MTKEHRLIAFATTIKLAVCIAVVYQLEHIMDGYPGGSTLSSKLWQILCFIVVVLILIRFDGKFEELPAVYQET